MAVVALQPLLSRETDPLQGGVVTVSRFNTGRRTWQRPRCTLACCSFMSSLHMCLASMKVHSCSPVGLLTCAAGPGASNIIPQSVNLLGTIRAFDQGTFTRLRQRVADVFSGTAEMYGCNATIDWSPVRVGSGGAEAWREGRCSGQLQRSCLLIYISRMALHMGLFPFSLSLAGALPAAGDRPAGHGAGHGCCCQGCGRRQRSGAAPALHVSEPALPVSQLGPPALQPACQHALLGRSA